MFQLGADLLPDFFLDSDDPDVEDIYALKGKKAAKQTSGGADELSSLFENIKGYCSEDVVSNTQAIYQFDITEHGSWFLDLKTGSGNFILFLIYISRTHIIINTKLKNATHRSQIVTSKSSTVRYGFLISLTLPFDLSFFRCLIFGE